MPKFVFFSEHGEDKIWIPKLLVDMDFVPSTSEARRRIQSGAVQKDGKKVTDVNSYVSSGTTCILRAGKRAMGEVTVKKKGDK